MNPEADPSSQERARRLERLVEISRNLCTSLDLEPFLHALIAAASELTNCETASILELDEEEEQLRFLALPWFHRERLKSVKVPIQNSAAGWVFESGKPFIIPDVATEPRHFKGADLVSAFVTRSLMAVPICYQGQKLGVLEVTNKGGDAHYTEDDLAILETLASQAAVAIQNTRLMNKIQKTEEGISHLDRMKSDFIGIASHELRTPLGLILGHATFLREIIDPEFQAQMDVIIRNSIRLKDIIDNLSKMDNAERGMANIRAQSISIKRIIEEVAESFQQEAQKRQITLRTDTGEAELNIRGDAYKISIALSNVVQNAIIFSNPEGHVLVAAEQIPGYVKVSVIDNGIGIPAKDLPHVFERFYQVESHLTRKHGGMGLGLSVAKVMIEMHGGRIWAESIENKGSNFTFILPAACDKADPGGMTAPS
jgi:signal transduction histidine kinase